MHTCEQVFGKIGIRHHSLVCLTMSLPVCMAVVSEQGIYTNSNSYTVNLASLSTFVWPCKKSYFRLRHNYSESRIQFVYVEATKACSDYTIRGQGSEEGAPINQATRSLSCNCSTWCHKWPKYATYVNSSIGPCTLSKRLNTQKRFNVIFRCYHSLWKRPLMQMFSLLT